MAPWSRFFHVGLDGYKRLAIGMTFLVVEAITRMVALFIPRFVVSMLDWLRVKIFGVRPDVPLVRPPPGVPGLESEDCTMDMDTAELIRLRGYECEEHSVLTEDGFLLTLHRVVEGPRTEQMRPELRKLRATATAHSGSRVRPAVLVQHGLLQNSEAFCVTDDALAFHLADRGFDVWLGNNRGNRYSHKHLTKRPSEAAYWDFSIDEMALCDIPSSITYILRATGQEKLSYVAFSQGTALGFASFSLKPEIAAKVNTFVALAPAALARGFQAGLLKTLVNIAPDSLFLFLGNRALLPSALFWRNYLSHSAFGKLLNMCMSYLFNWTTLAISPSRQRLLYAHLYSYGSVKTVVHWMQVVAAGRFQMYDDSMSSGKYRGAVPARFPIERISCPIHIFYGGRDFLPDFDGLFASLPKSTKVTREDSYEHLDVFWADSAAERVFPHVTDALVAAQAPLAEAAGA